MNLTKFKLQTAVEISYGKSWDELFISVGLIATTWPNYFDTSAIILRNKNKFTKVVIGFFPSGIKVGGNIFLKRNQNKLSLKTVR